MVLNQWIIFGQDLKWVMIGKLLSSENVLLLIGGSIETKR
jgi:hypothetical protein